MEKIEEQIALGERIHESVVNHETEEIKSSVVLPEDEVNVEAANQVITEPGTATLTHTDGTYEEVQVFPYPEDTTLVQQSISTLKEFATNVEFLKKFESEGFTFDYNAINKAIGTVTEAADQTPAAVACACTDCVEGSGVDTDLEQIVADMSERLAKLEERIALYNVKASHKL